MLPLQHKTLSFLCPTLCSVFNTVPTAMLCLLCHPLHPTATHDAPSTPEYGYMPQTLHLKVMCVACFSWAFHLHTNADSNSPTPRLCTGGTVASGGETVTTINFCADYRNECKLPGNFCDPVANPQNVPADGYCFPSITTDPPGYRSVRKSSRMLV